MGNHTKDLQKTEGREWGSHAFALTLLVGACVTSIGLLILEPAVIGFIGAVLTAIAWCIWIERHPDTSPAPDDDPDADADHRPNRTPHVFAALILVAASASAHAQTATAGDPNPGTVTLTAETDRG